MSNIVHLRPAKAPRYEDWIAKTGIPSVDSAIFVAFCLGRKVQRDTDDELHWEDMDRAVAAVVRELAP